VIKLYKRVTAKTYGVSRLDGTVTDLQNIHWATLRLVYILKTRHHVA